MKGIKIQDLVFFILVAAISLFFPKFEKYIPSKEVLSQVEVINPSITVFPPQNGQVLRPGSARVTKVTDGDTIEVYLDAKKEKIRIIGINSPETVDPRRPVECFGKEASSYAKSLLIGKIVTLEADQTQANKDKYGRLLRYVYFENKTDFGLEMIKNGFAYEYTYDLPYKHQMEYKEAQKEAELSQSGLWGSKACRN